MSYVRVESSVRTNRKFLKAGPAPSWLWLCGLLYCQEGLTDGFIPDEAIDFLGVRNARRLVEHLIGAGLWAETEGGWQIHDYLVHNKSADEVNSIKQMRKQFGSKGGKAKAKQVASDVASDTFYPYTSTATATATATAAKEKKESRETSSLPSVLVFQTIGNGPKTWDLSQQQIELWIESYPGVDVLGECKKAKAWLNANHLKTAGGMSKFLVRWLGRSADKATGRLPVEPIAGPKQADNVSRYLAQKWGTS